MESSFTTNAIVVKVVKIVNGTNYYLTSNNTWSTSDANIYIVTSGTITPGTNFATVNLSSYTEIANADYVYLYVSSPTSGVRAVDFTFS